MFRMAFALLVMSTSLVAVVSRADAQQRQVQVGQAEVGLDVGFTSGGVIAWTVFADSNRRAGKIGRAVAEWMGTLG